MNNSEFFISADCYTFLAFSLAGVPGQAADTPDAARTLLSQACEDPGVGLILITERLSKQITKEVEEARRDRVKPLILEIPDLAGALPQPKPLLDRLRALMGIPR